MSDHAVAAPHPRLPVIWAAAEHAMGEARFQDAADRFSEGLELDDQFRRDGVTMYAHRAYCRQQLGDPMGAIRDYGKAIELEAASRHADHYLARAACFAELGDHEEHAVADCGRAIELRPDHLPAFWLRGKLLVDLERFEEALADLDTFLASSPHPEALQLRGYAKLCLGRGRDAIADLQESRRVTHDVYTDYLLAWAGATAPDDELFYQSMEAVLRADPSYRSYFAELDDYARFRHQPRFAHILGVS